LVPSPKRYSRFYTIRFAQPEEQAAQSLKTDIVAGMTEENSRCEDSHTSGMQKVNLALAGSQRAAAQ
jgi:hypothetical protein